MFIMGLYIYHGIICLSWDYMFIMGLYIYHVVFILIAGDQCPALPPNCHPYCIKYDVAQCRKCECTSKYFNT